MSIDLSRVENILETMLGRSEIKEPAQSRVEELLIELKEAIEEGGTGGDVTALTARIAKCERDISSIETVDEAQTQQIQSIATSLGEFRTAIESLDTDVENKADKSTTYTKTEVDTALSAKQDTISDLTAIRSGATLGATAVQPVSGKGLSTNDFTDAEKTKLDNHVADTSNPHQVTKAQVGLGNVDNVATKEVLAELLDSGQKNLLKITRTSQTIRNVTFTVNDDGTVSVDGTNNTSSSAVFHLDVLSADTASNYNGCILTGCPQGGSTSTYRLTLQLNSGAFTSYASDIGNGATIHDVPASDCRVVITVYPGVTVSNLIFKPMICTAESYAISPKSVPYRPSYDELVARIEALERAGE